MIRLRPVLHKIFTHLKAGAPVWDLCCDHGLLGLHALETGHSTEVHFVDQSVPVMEKLKQENEGTPGAHFYLLDATRLPAAVEGNVVIAGVGSHTMIKILDKLVCKGPTRILLSSNNKPQLLKDYIASRGWQAYIIDASEVKESHRLRPFFRIDLPAND